MAVAKTRDKELRWKHITLAICPFSETRRYYMDRCCTLPRAGDS